MKKLLTILTLIISLFTLTTPLQAQDNPVNLYFFNSQSCPHCAKQEEFLKTLPNQYPYLKIHSLEITKHPQNAQLLTQVGKQLGINTQGIPLTIISDQYLTGFNPQTTAPQIISLIKQTRQQGDPDPTGRLISQSSLTPTYDKITPTQPSTSPTLKSQAPPDQINFPLIGQINLKNLSLPALTFFIALLDGFNPCAMWVLLFLISILLNVKSKSRRWILGLSFIIVSGFVYFLFLSAWLNFFLFVGFIYWVRLAVGLLAVIAGTYYLKDYFSNPQTGCETTNQNQRQKLLSKLKRSVQQHNLLLAILGLSIIAFAVNLIELICSAGLPAIYTQILTLNNLPPIQYYLYLAFYILIFIIDDLIIFTIAMSTLHAIGIQKKYSRLSRLIGGILIFLLGLALIFKPELLTLS